MSRARTFDLRYEHEMRAVPASPTASVRPAADGRDLVARLRCLKILMDAERGAGLRSSATVRTLHS